MGRKWQKTIGRKDYIENDLLTSLSWALTVLVDSSLLATVGKAHNGIVFEQGFVGKPGFETVVKMGKFLWWRSSMNNSIREESTQSTWGLARKQSSPEGKHILARKRRNQDGTNEVSICTGRTGHVPKIQFPILGMISSSLCPFEFPLIRGLLGLPTSVSLNISSLS